MKKVIISLLVILCFLTVGLVYWNLQKKKERVTLRKKVQIRSNERIKNFRVAKKILRRLYRGREESFYCGCSFKGARVDHQSCGFKSIHPGKRSNRIEWEHIVPASHFGRSFSAWRKGDPSCKNSRGRTYKGRRCARKVSTEFRRMEADLYNLVPAIGEVNQKRNYYPFGFVKDLSDTKEKFGLCESLFGDKIIQPRPKVRGFIARVYKYMNAAYPRHGILAKKKEKLFNSWDAHYPPTQEEIIRARAIKSIQENENIFVMNWNKYHRNKRIVQYN
jgi:deoxyribonuclease I